jgi:hypothetical protein
MVSRENPARSSSHLTQVVQCERGQLLGDAKLYDYFIVNREALPEDQPMVYRHCR